MEAYARLIQGLEAIKDTSTDPASRRLADSILNMAPLIVNERLDAIIEKAESQHDEATHTIDYDRYCMTCTPTVQLVEEARIK